MISFRPKSASVMSAVNKNGVNEIFGQPNFFSRENVQDLLYNNSRSFEALSRSSEIMFKNKSARSYCEMPIKSEELSKMFV